MDVLLWGVLPYVVLVLLVGGTVWRYRYDKFGWTTRSSQLYESRLLRIGSPLFHFGILLVLVGHIGGLVIPLILLLGMALGAVLGSFNGLIITYGKVPPIIATLGTLSIYRGLVLYYSQGT